jgi:hypothetical protein
VRIFPPIFLLIFATTAHALSLPLQGYYHPGRAMPVKWDVPDSGSDIQISAPGAIVSRAHPAGNPWGLFPWIVYTATPGPTSHASLGALQPLDPSDLLVIDLIAEEADPSELFPNRRLVTVPLDPEELTGPAMAWESADAILLTPDSYTKIPIDMRTALFAEGVELAVLTISKPDDLFPWVQNGSWWTASPNLNLPPIVCPAAYLPTYGWITGRTQAFRKQIVGLGVIYFLVIVGISLLRRRWTPVAIVAASILAIAAFHLENQRQSPIFAQSGIIRLSAPAPIEDDWLFQTTHRPAHFTLPVGGEVHPIFSDESQAKFVQLVLDCDASGRPTSISGDLAPDQPLVLMRRNFAPAAPPGSQISPPTSPLRLLASESIYPGWTVAGQLPAVSPDSWPPIFLARN